MILNRWVYMFLGIVFFIGLIALRNYMILQATGSGGSEGALPSIIPSSGAPSSTPSSGASFGGAASSPGETISIPSVVSTSGLSSGANIPQIPQSPNSLAPATGNSLPQPAVGTDPATLQHTSVGGGRTDIEQIGQITVSQAQAYTGDDIAFAVTIKNTAQYKKFVRQLCFQSSERNFGCSPGFNLDPGQVFTISNSGRFESPGGKSVWVTWTQDNTNFYTPVNSSAARVQIL